MQNLPVHWYEGLFLRPQHLQAADRHWSELGQISQSWDLPFHYGVHAVEISEAALANYELEVVQLQARMRDRTLVSIKQGQEPNRVNLKKAFDDAESIDVLVGVPKLQMGRANVSNNGEGDTRYSELRVDVEDESQGGNKQELQFRQLNAKILLSTDDASGYDCLPIARLKRAGAAETTPQLDVEYIPPLLSTGAWPKLSKDIIRTLYDVIGEKLQVLSEQVLNREIGLGSQDPGDADRIVMLNQLNSAYATLAVVAFAKGVHPFLAYTELCRVYGQLAIFEDDRRASDIPAYQHENLYPLFHDIDARIRTLINKVQAYQYVRKPFLGKGMQLEVQLEPEWFHATWQWFIGVRKGELGVAEVRTLLSPGVLDWKFGSAAMVYRYFIDHMPGLELKEMDRPVRALPAARDWVYFEVIRNDKQPWREVQQSQSLALQMNSAKILNLDKLQGQRQLVISYESRTVPLEFALFAVPLNQ